MVHGGFAAVSHGTRSSELTSPPRRGRSTGQSVGLQGRDSLTLVVG